MQVFGGQGERVFGQIFIPDRKGHALLGKSQERLVRGFTGFGSGLVMVPLLALLWGPVEALAAMVGLGSIATLQLLPRAVPMNKASTTVRRCISSRSAIAGNR